MYPPSSHEAETLLENRFFDAYQAHQSLSTIRYRAHRALKDHEKEFSVTFITDYIEGAIIGSLGEINGITDFNLSIVSQDAEARDYVVKSLTLPQGETRTIHENEVDVTYNQSTLEDLWIETIPQRDGSGIFSQKLVGLKYLLPKQP